MMIIALLIAAAVCMSLGFGITGSSSHQNSTSFTDTSYHPEDNSVQATGPVTQVQGGLTQNITNSADAALGDSLLHVFDTVFKNGNQGGGVDRAAANGVQVTAAPAAPADQSRLLLIGGAVLVAALAAVLIVPKLLSKKA